MSAPRVVGLRDVHALRRALADELMVALPGIGGYYLATGADLESAVRRPEDSATAAATPSTARHFMVGHNGQARALAGRWSDETGRLVERCWPGPVTIIIEGTQGDIIRVSMATHRPLRRLCRETGPWIVVPLGATSAAGVADDPGAADCSLVVDGGTCDGPGTTVVECTGPQVRVVHEGALPATFIEAALLMGARRRRWTARRAGPRPGQWPVG
jgi:tRNA A37 threonylcarbamoyladenosine synthetase subunit TsaC/SUA5/YrdC